MHAEVREIFHELRIHRDELARTVEKDRKMSEALTKATLDLATASAALKATIDNAVMFIQDVPNLIAQAIASAANDADAVAAVQAVTAQLRADGDAVVTAMRTPPPAPAPAPAPTPVPEPAPVPDAAPPVTSAGDAPPAVPSADGSATPPANPSTSTPAAS